MKSKALQTMLVLILIVPLLSGLFTTGFAAGPVDAYTQEPVASRAPGPINPQELEAFLNDLVAEKLEENHVPGAMVAVVEDGRILLAKGYGYADLEGQVRVDPEQTLFRVGSVSKLFVWTAVMQLMEQGLLDLDVDVNEYLDFAIPATYAEPITMRHLMSHTAGFEDKGSGMHKLQAGQMGTLDEYLKTNLPQRVFPPGEISAYSNYGATLAGYIVERLSGQPFHEYVEQNIFGPLGMAHSTFRQPVPETLVADLATGYNYSGEEYIPGGFVYDQAYPGGSLSSTADDMARFMIAHLQNGELDGQRILQEETARQMHSQLYTTDPQLQGGMAYGFFENTINGQRVISHGGNLFTFISGLHLIPERNVGVFISTNGTHGSQVLVQLIEAFLDRYYPAEGATDLQSVSGIEERIAPYLGEYTPARSNFSTLERVYSLTARPSLKLGEDGLLVLSLPGQESRFAEVEPGLLQAVDDPSVRWTYRRGSDGQYYLAGVGGIWEPQGLIKTPWYGTRSLHMLLFLSATVLFLGAVAAWPIGAIIRRRRDPEAVAPRPARLAHWAAALFGLLWTASLLGIASIFMDILPGFGVPRIVFGIPPVMDIVLVLVWALAGLALAMAAFTVLAWLRRYWGLGGRIFYSLLTLLALLLTWSLAYWNLL